MDQHYNVMAPLDVPPFVLLAALQEAYTMSEEMDEESEQTGPWDSEECERLREMVRARLVMAALTAKVRRLKVFLKYADLVTVVMDAIRANNAHLTALDLGLGEPLPPIVALALPTMKSLTHLAIYNATDIHLAAIAAARPPLATLDVERGEVTDVGIKVLLGVREDITVKELLGVDVKGLGCPATTLTSIKALHTEVSSFGCLVALVACPTLSELTCHNIVDALDFFVRRGCGRSKDALALTHLKMWNKPRSSMHDIGRAYPLLTEVEIWCSDNKPVSVADITASLPALTNLTIHYIRPGPEPSILPSYAPHLTHLYLRGEEIYPYPVCLFTLAHACPALTHLTLGSLLLTLPSPPPPCLPSCLEYLCLMTPIDYGMAPDVGMWAMVWARNATSITLGHCGAFTDQHISRVLDQDALRQVEKLRLASIGQVTGAAFHAMIVRSPRLLSLTLNGLSKRRRPMYWSLNDKIKRQKDPKVKLRMSFSTESYNMPIYAIL